MLGLLLRCFGGPSLVSRVLSEAEIEPIKKVNCEGNLPVSLNQEKRLLTEELRCLNLTRHYPPFNFTLALSLEGVVNATEIEIALNRVIIRHAVLRAAFFPADDLAPQERQERLRIYSKTGAIVQGLYKQAVVPCTPLSLVVRDVHVLKSEPEDSAIARIINQERSTAFDYRRPPLMRALLLHLGSKRHLLVIVISQLVSDMQSVRILQREWITFYENGDAKERYLPTPLSHIDFVYWQKSRLPALPDFRQAVFFWQRQWLLLEGKELQFRDLPAASSSAPFGLGSERLTLDSDFSDRLRTFAKKENVTLYMLFLAMFDILLHHWSGKSLIGVWTHFANRTRPETENVIGWFENVHIIGVDFEGDPSGHELLKRVQCSVLDAMANQQLPLNYLWGTLYRCLQRSDMRITFDLITTNAEPSSASGELRVKPIMFRGMDAGRVLKLKVYDDGKRIRLLTSCPSEFRSTVVVNTLDHLRHIAEKFLSDPGERVSNLF